MESGLLHAPEGGPLRYDISGLSLLYVEDEADARSMVSKMLAMNYPKLKLFSAENGAVGLDLYREQLPDIVMTDINMPVMDGIRMSREIKSLNPEAHIIAVTAHSDTSYLLNAIEIGVYHYVLKPINYEELFGVMDKILEQLALKRLVWEQNQRIIQSEYQLSEAQRIAHLGSWQRDLTDGSMDWSGEMFRICGIEPGAVPPSYQLFLERIVPEDRDGVHRALHDAIDNREQVSALFCRVRRSDGTLRTLRIDAEVMLDGSGVPALMLGTSHDVTELKQAEEQIRSLTEELERRVLQRTSMLQASVKELDNFSYVVSHDLRAPVARLEGFCQALLEDCSECPNSACKEYAVRAQRVVCQIKRIIDAFNNLSHYARCKLAVQEVDLSALGSAIAESLRKGEPGRGVEFRIQEGMVVQGDARLLAIVLEQLLENAWKFTSKKDAALIELGRLEREGEPVFFVRDNGAGFNTEYVEKLFKPFQTIHTPGEYGWDGTSIGLATVHSIVLRHGGEVWAEGEVGKGATFYFTLERNPEAGSFIEEPEQR